ncbi:MAG: hypothetical protein CL946_08510 [Ectothiorhodospiraceae bacterium]|nr:hypothetical protein [Ectothiorhodospiraceae bacterium]
MDSQFDQERVVGVKPIAVFRSFQENWNRLYKHHGLSALLRCVRGSIGSGAPLPENGERAETQAITFSVVPQLTKTWLHALQQALAEESVFPVLGDCSGSLAVDENDAFVYATYNAPHGEKLDAFFASKASADYILVCDDDILWTDAAPLRYALEQLRADPSLAVVSLHPRSHVSSLLREVATEAMGSYCIVVNRAIWEKERLSFRIEQPPANESHDWFYDTADKANRLLVERGYRIHIAPDEVLDSLISLEGASTWVLKAQKTAGDIQNELKHDPVLRAAKAYRVYRFAELLYTTEALPLKIREYPMLKHEYLHKAKQCFSEILDADARSSIDKEVQEYITRLVDLFSTSE